MNEPPDPEIAVFAAALELPADKRGAYLDQACAGNPAVRRQVESLIRVHDEAGHFFDQLAPMARPASDEGTTMSLPSIPVEHAGDRIGRYKLLQQIGEGGCGVVYMAEQEAPVRRRVALKILKLGLDTKSVIARFEAERQALALMDHPNIAKVLDAGATETGRPYFVMELVRSVKITDYCDENKLSTAERLELFAVVCQAIQHAHQKGIIHRDIKPSNVLVADHDGQPVPKIIDFGIAKATSDQRLTDKTLFTAFEQFIGTPAYMSPEQAKLSGLDIDTRSDIYSLGVLLYELLTGKTPFEARRLLEAGLEEVRRIIWEEEPLRPSTKLQTLEAAEQTTLAQRRQSDPPKLAHLIRGDLDWIVMKCLEKDRGRRYETANGLALDIQRYLGNEPVLARPPSAGYRLQKAWRRNKTGFAAATLIAAVLVAATAISAWEAVRATRADVLSRKRLAESQANETLAKDRLAESQAISKFLIEVFQSPDPTRDGRTITVAEALGAAAKKLETALTNQPARRAKIQGTLAITYNALGLEGEAIKLQESVRDYYLAASGWENSDTLETMQNLASFYLEASRIEEALKLREQVLALRQKINGPEDPNTLDAMSNLAISYDDVNRFKEALNLREQVLSARKKVLGPEHLGTVAAMNNLAVSYQQAGRLGEAIKLQEQVLLLRRKLNRPEHPDTLRAMGNLADSYDQVGRRSEALQLREELLPLCRKVLGPEHHRTIGIMLSLATSYSEAGRQEDALNLREQTLALCLKANQPERPDTLSAMHNLANSYEETGRPGDALKLREQLLTLRRKVSGPENADTLNAMNNLANSYDKIGRRDEALKLREQVLTLRIKVLGPENADTVMAMGNLAISYQQTGRLNEAVTLREHISALRQKMNGPENSETTAAMSTLAASYEVAGRREEALKSWEELLPLYVKVNGPTNRDTFWLMNKLVSFYADVGRYKEATSLLGKFCDLDPKNTDSSLTLATWQTWFGLDTDYESTRRRLVQQAEGTSQAQTAERAVKACCLRPSTDNILLTNTLTLARRAVELGQGSTMLGSYQLSLGIAELRNGQYPASEQTLGKAEQLARNPSDLQGIARMFRAMSLFQQGKVEEARNIFRQAVSQMPPLPNDESKPLLDGKPASRDVLIGWLAYKEARALMEEASPTK